MILVVLFVEGDEVRNNSEVDEFQAYVDGLLVFCSNFPCKKSHCFSDCCEFDIWLHIDRVNSCNCHLVSLYLLFFKSFL